MIVSNTTYKFKKAVEITIADLDNLNEILDHYCNKIKYEAKLNNAKSVEFDDLAELKTYNNEKESKIIELRVLSSCEQTLNKIDIHFRVKGDLYKAYSDTIEIDYKLNDKKLETLFLEEIESCFSSMQKDPFYIFFSKGSSNIISIIICLMLFAVSVREIFVLFSVGVDVEVNGYSSIEFFLAVVILLIFLTVCVLLDKLWKFMFPPIVFLVGNEIKNNEFKSKIRSGIFFTGLLGVVASILASFVVNIFT